MTHAFQHKLNEELLLSERRRTIILIGIFSTAIGFRLFQFFFVGIDEETQLLQSFNIAWLFPFSLVFFETISLLYINRRIKANKMKIPPAAQYVNTAFEICMPSAIILMVAKEYPSYNILHSPAIYIYFVFISVSTLRLKFSLSFFCGLLASLSYISFSIFIYNHFSSTDAAIAIIMLLCGIAAGLVAKQIRLGINNSMNEAERRQKVENLFGQQISVEVAEKMLENNGRFESKRMNVAVMFIDIRNFSKFAAGKSPEEIVQYQNAFFSIVINTVTKHKGIVHQFLGDGCMITFGAPLSLDNPSVNAVNAAIELKQNLRDAIVKGNIPDTTVRMGIHSGDAVTGNIGTDTRQQYSVTGNVVIIAARVEQLNKQLGTEVLITEEVFNKIKDTPNNFQHVGELSVKGFEQPIIVYKLA